MEAEHEGQDWGCLKEKVILNRTARALFLPIIVATLISCQGKNTKSYTDAHFALGTVCTITLYERDDDFDFREAFDLIDAIESAMSSSIPESEVSAINAAAGAGPVSLSHETFSVLQESRHYAELSGGLFDITVQPLVTLWGIGTEDQRLPDPVEIAAALALVGYEDAILSQQEQSVLLRREGMAIDLGGIAKGYAADEVKTLLIDRGFSRGIINLGGNIITFGRKVNGKPWRIGVQDPFDSRGRFIATVDVGEAAVVTSGVYERYFEQDGVQYHHIFDTRTGYPVANELVSVTVVAREGIAADALSTIAFSLGLSAGMAFLDGTPGADGVFVTRERQVSVTSGIRDTFTLTSSDYRLLPP